MLKYSIIFLYCFLFSAPIYGSSDVKTPSVKLGVDQFFEEQKWAPMWGKRVGLITNQTGVNARLESTISLFKARGCLIAIFSPEHGITGAALAAAKVSDGQKGGIQVFSLHGSTRRPTEEMLKGIELLVFDIQEIGSRSYTYISTLFYAMEEAAKHKIPFLVLDRPNPMGGILVDGPMLDDKWRSFLGYIDIPYCHGMTVGELAQFFNAEYRVGVDLKVVPMSGWKRDMIYRQTGCPWIPTSPYIPEPDTPFYYASTGILGALGVVSIGIGYTLPFKVVGAPWIDGEKLAATLNAQKLPGVQFVPTTFSPFYGKFKGETCQGVHILIKDHVSYKPLAVQYLLIGMIKSLYPSQFRSRIEQMAPQEKESFCKVNGGEGIWKILMTEQYVSWKLIGYDEERRSAYREKRKKYLLYD